MSARRVAGVASGTFLVALTAAVTAAGPVAPPAHATGQGKVVICHATSSAKNPYTLISVSVRAVDGSRANDHSSHPNDIIPPFAGGSGQNWNARGQAIFAAGCSTVVLTDTDGDGLRDVVDPDDDGDGIVDIQDLDDDGDGVNDDQDPDQGLKTDTDGDGVPDALDRDDDGDGIRDVYDADDDGDGIPDISDPDRPGATDTDNDCIADRDDLDDNNDGIFEPEPVAGGDEFAVTSPVGGNQTRPSPSSACVPTDTDRDGIIDSIDPDDNGDGKPDRLTTDADGDGIPDYRDPDDDGDGIPDLRDLDDDGDGVPEVIPQVAVVVPLLEVQATDGEAVLLREAAVLTDAGQRAAVTITCRVVSTLRFAPRLAPMDGDGPAFTQGSGMSPASGKSCRIKRTGGGWVALVTPGTQAVAMIRFRAPAVGDRLPLDVTQSVRISG